MSKKDYVDAMNEISPRENLKKETFNKVKYKKKKYNKLYPIASLAIMATLIISIGVPLRNRQSQPTIIKEANKEESKEEIKIEEGSLQRVESFENLYAMLKEMKGSDFYYTDDVLMESTTISTNGAVADGATSDYERGKYSTTNTQVQGVDEADIVKTDGNYIYYLSNEKVTITSVNNSELKIVSTIEVSDKDFNPRELFLRNDRLVIIGTKYSQSDVMPLLEENQKQRTWYNSNSYTIIKVYNISNREKPELARTVEIEGSYLSARMVGDNIYLMSNKYIYSYLCKDYEIEELNQEAFKPRYTDTAVSSEEKTIEFSDISCIPNFDTAEYLNVVAFNVTNNEAANIETYLGAGSEIYSSAENLYVAKAKYDYSGESHELTTDIYRFSLGDAKCTFEKSGVVPGTILNQFSMDEDGKYFRIATTNSKSWESEDDTNNLYVLDENLEIVGKVEGLAKGEKIYSVRFMGNRAYMVTFVQTDPLFVIDLSNPANPTVLGELKIPGYSKYLHPYDETHLIGFGENTKVVNYGYGDQVVTDGMKMALFDVTDPNNPKELYSVDIGEKGTSSELLYNHKALLFSKEKDIIAFPISITTDDYEVEFQGAVVYGLNLEQGFTLKGRISNTEDNYGIYNSRNKVERIIYIGNTLFTLSDNSIKATDMNTMKKLNYIEF